MAFTKALFYPTIDIKNENWLKTAILFWDEINTIVPASIDNPYQENATQYLCDEGILKPIQVNSENDFIEELASDTLNYLNTNEGFQLLTQGHRQYTIHRDKLPRDISRLFDIHPEKLPYEIQYHLRHRLTNEGWLRVDGGFAKFYMTLLANKISEHYGIAPLTDNSLTSNFSDLVRLDNQIAISGRERDYDYRPHRERYINLQQGLLVNMALESISISEPTSLEDVIKFKRKHQDELGLFRKNVENLTKNIPEDASLVQIRQLVEDVYINEFKPGYNTLTNSLKGSGIKWAADNLMKVSFFSTGATAIPTALLGLSVPYALLAGVGISIISSLVSYNVDKRNTLRNNPYSYLLAINKGV